ncbi:hypothetical protein B0H10DRAFT_1077598 [Mycena sp. CBHHK59/15]|nr:hypothetical protein B0H10DRAFT_1077598 [Mycena sp. CBHHK59/15]
MSLPTHAGHSTPKLTRYVVQSSDVLEDLRVNVMEENSDKVIWYKERFLEDEEIIEHLVHNATSTICWTMHRPRNGWYIRLRTPMFPPGAFIPLTPPPLNTAHPQGALLFKSRTNIPNAPDPSASTSTVHSYPPTPPPVPSVVVQPPTPASVQAKLDQAQGKQRHHLPPTQISEFVLAPYAAQQALNPEQTSFFQRALSLIKSHSSGPDYSFALSRIAAPSPSSVSPPPYISNSSMPSPVPSDSVLSLASVSQAPPLLVFHDRTPVMIVRSLTGLIEIGQAEEQSLGVESSFWIAVALTYLEFLQEKESYLAALSD